MDDDPFLPAIDTSGRSNSANNVTINNFGRTGVIIMVVVCGLALGLSVGAVVIATLQSNAMSAKAAEASASATELRIYVDELTLEMAKAGIKVPPIKE